MYRFSGVLITFFRFNQTPCIPIQNFTQILIFLHPHLLLQALIAPNFSFLAYLALKNESVLAYISNDRPVRLPLT